LRRKAYKIKQIGKQTRTEEYNQCSTLTGELLCPPPPDVAEGEEVANPIPTPGPKLNGLLIILASPLSMPIAEATSIRGAPGSSRNHSVLARKKSRLHHISSPISHPPITPISVSITYLNCGEPDDEAIDARADSPGSCGNEAL
jgi:hypothetical protein